MLLLLNQIKSPGNGGSRVDEDVIFPPLCIITRTWFHVTACVCVCVALEADRSVAVFQLVFEALHSQEPRGYVVGWIIAISLLVGILIFLLLAVLLWKVNTWTQIDSSTHTTAHFSGHFLLTREGVVTNLNVAGQRPSVWLWLDDSTASSCAKQLGKGEEVGVGAHFGP